MTGRITNQYYRKALNNVIRGLNACLLIVILSVSLSYLMLLPDSTRIGELGATKLALFLVGFVSILFFSIFMGGWLVRRFNNVEHSILFVILMGLVILALGVANAVKIVCVSVLFVGLSVARFQLAEPE